MANTTVGFAYSAAAANLYALIRNRAGEVWDAAVDLAFETYATANLGDYDVALTEQGTASRYYVFTFPSGIAAGRYYVTAYLRAGGSPAEGDTAVAEGYVDWDGSEIVDGSNVGAVSWDATAANNLELMYDGTGYTADDSAPSSRAQVNSLGAAGGGSLNYEAAFDNTTQDTIDAGAAVDKGDGTVGIPVTGHAFTAGRQVTITGTANYDASYTIVSQTTNEVVITATYVAETFAGTETINSSIKTVEFVGSVSSGTYVSTESEDGVYHVIADDTDAFDVVYQYNIGGARTGVEVIWRGYLTGANDSFNIQAYDFDGASWDTIRTVSGQAGTDNQSRTIPLLSKHTGTGSDIGKVLIRLVTSGQSTPTLNTDQLIVEAVSNAQSVGYADGAIWVDTNKSNTNTESFVDGVADNPVSTWAAAITLSGQLGITRFRVHGTSSITLTGSAAGYDIIGDGLFTLALGGQAVTNAYIVRASITGTGSGSGAIFEDCRINAGASTGPSFFVRCGFAGTSGSPWTANGAGEYALVDCVSLAAAALQPYFDFSGTGSATSANIRRFGGGINYTGDSDVDASIEVLGGGAVSVTTGGGDVEVRGISRAVTATMSAAETFRFSGITGPITLNGTTTATVDLYGVSASLTDNTSAATVTDLTVSGTDQDSILGDTVDIQSRIPAALSSAGNMKADVEEIAASAAAATALKNASLAMQSGTVQTAAGDANSATAFDTDLAVENADYYGSASGGLVIAFVSGTAQQFQTRRIIASTTVSSNTRVTLEEALDGTPTDADTFVVLGRITELS